MEKFVEYIEEEMKRLYETFPQQPIIRLTNVQTRGHEAAEVSHLPQRV